MGSYVLSRTQRLPIDIGTAWDFFSTPDNLDAITPPDVRFRQLSPAERMYEGQIIRYYISPVLGIPLFWMTEITHVREKEYFVDEQRFGPYSFWHHKHFFVEIPGGVEMRDVIDYKLPLGILGHIAHALFVRHKLEAIFEYRYRVLEERFGRYQA